MAPGVSDSWVAAPRHLPHRCHRSGQSRPEDGPYFEEGFLYAETGGDDRELTLYHSLVWIRGMLEAEGSPLAYITRADLGLLADDLARAHERAEGLADDLALAKESLARLGDENRRLAERPRALDEGELATRLAERLKPARQAKGAGR